MSWERLLTSSSCNNTHSSIHPSSHYFLSFAGLQGGWNPSQLTLGERRDVSPVHHRALAITYYYMLQTSQHFGKRLYLWQHTDITLQRETFPIIFIKALFHLEWQSQQAPAQHGLYLTWMEQNLKEQLWYFSTEVISPDPDKIRRFFIKLLQYGV